MNDGTYVGSQLPFLVIETIRYDSVKCQCLLVYIWFLITFKPSPLVALSCPHVVFKGHSFFRSSLFLGIRALNSEPGYLCFVAFTEVKVCGHFQHIWCLYRHLCILPERFGKKD